eukprot:TRINITY_DN67972_c0_g1_i1.p1 TRINITY_DN67972_c0_g1~~TRINITY_DN67972_c0_g1_i1.p1  ORF type:complete len:135 (-),score=13.17 TRINITY_DN67972_c0_g1_i1:49-453(-)
MQLFAWRAIMVGMVLQRAETITIRKVHPPSYCSLPKCNAILASMHNDTQKTCDHFPECLPCQFCVSASLQSSQGSPEHVENDDAMEDVVESSNDVRPEPCAPRCNTLLASMHNDVHATCSHFPECLWCNFCKPS